MDNTAQWVLIIDDDPEARAMIRRLLDTDPQHAYRFEEYADGASGLGACLRNGGTAPDCLLLADRLPDSDASTLLQALDGDQGIRCPVVVLSGEDSHLDCKEALRAGAQDILGKRHLNASSLARAMDNAIARHALARELRRSEARLRLGTQVAGLAPIEVDYLRDTLTLSPEASAILGLPGHPATVPRAVVHALFHPEDRAAIEAHIARALEPGQGWLALEHRVVTPKGQVRWLSARKQVLFRPCPGGAKPVSALLMMRDITEQKLAEAQARENQARLAGIVDSAMDAIITVDSAQRVVLFNAAAERIFRCPVAEAIGGPLERFIPQGVRAAHREHFRRFNEAPVRSYTAGRLGAFSGLRADGEEFPLEASISRIEIGGEPFFTVILRDITRRQQAEDALRESEGRYRGLLEQAADGIFVSDAEGRYLDVNSAGAAMLGYSREEVLRLGIPDVIASWEIPRIGPEVAKFADGDVVRSEWLFRRKDDSLFPGEVMGKRLPDGRLQGIVRDISERKESEAKLWEQAQRLREADRRKDEFLAMLAHELRNPLAPIRNAVEILRHPGLPASELAWCRDIVERQIEQLTRLVDDLLDVSRITRGRIDLKQAPVEVAAILGRGVETSRPLLEKHGHHLLFKLPDKPLWVRGDLIRLAQVVSNLLNNAAKYTDPGGRVELSAWEEPGRAVIGVRDNGRGIAPEALPDVFDLFYQVDYTLDRAQGGLGIGLSLVKRLVELHGGEVKALSEGPGKGSEFILRLPKLEGSEFPPGDTPQAPPPKGRRRVLIVDDNEDAAESLSLLLSLEGHDTLTAHNGPEALTLALAARPRVILLDIGLPGLSGYEVCRKLREAGLTETLIVAVTGYGQEGDIHLAREAGFDAHRVKPVDPADIQGLLGRVDGD